MAPSSDPRRTNCRRGWGWRRRLAAACWWLGWSVSSLSAASTAVRDFDIPAGEASAALRQFVQVTNEQLLYSTKVVAGVRTQRVAGRMNSDRALRIMLRGSGLSMRQDPVTGAFAVFRSSPALPAAEEAKVVAREEKPAADDGSPSILSPFIVSELRADSGYISTQTSLGRLASNLTETPGSYVVINRQLMDDLNSSSLLQLMSLGVSGVTARQGDAFDDMTFRGFRTGNQLRNGVLKRSFKRNEVYDIERVEVIKGPGGMLLGSSTIQGGAVNYVTRKPTVTHTGYVNLTAGNKAIARVEANDSGPLFSRGELSAYYRATVGGNTGGRAKSNETDNQRFVGGALSFKFGDRWSLALSGSWTADNSYIYYNDFLDVTKLPAAVLHPQSLAAAPSRKGDAYDRGTERFLDLELLLKATEHSDLRVFYNFYDYRQYENLIFGVTVLPDNRTVTRNGIRYDSPIASTNNTVQFDYIHQRTFGRVASKLMIGLEANFEKLAQNPIQFSSVPTVANYAPFDLFNPDFSNDEAVAALARPQSGALLQRYENHSWFIQDNLTWFDGRLILVGGVRWIDPQITSTDFFLGTVTKANIKPTRTHKYGAVYAAVPWLSVYAANAQNLTARTGFLANPDLASPVPLKDSFLRMQEYGLKLNATPRPGLEIYLTAAHFDMTLTNVPTFIQSGDRLVQIQTAGTSSRGWEADLGGRIEVGDAVLDLIATFYDADIRDVDTGLPTREAPARVRSLWGKLSWARGPWAGFAVGAGVHDESDKRSGEFLLHAPAVYNALARYQLDRRWSFQVNVENLTDARHINVVIMTGQVMSSNSRSVRFSTRYRW